MIVIFLMYLAHNEGKSVVAKMVHDRDIFNVFGS